MPTTQNPLRSRMAYSDMVAEIRQALATGKLNVGDRLAGETVLAKQYGISVSSVRRGFEQLVEEGLLDRRKGSGTYVQKRPFAQAVRPSRRDTVALIWPVSIATYHPFYTEIFSALRSTLGQLGWVIWEPALEETGEGTDLQRFTVGPEQVRDVVAEHPELMGLITRSWLATDELSQIRKDLPVVTSDLVGPHAAVAYRWADELERGFRELLGRGCQRLWCMTVFEDDDVRQAAQKAARALGRPEPELVLEQTSSSNLSYSRTTQVAFDLAKRDLTPRVSAYDGVFAGDDFLCQGVLDALQECRDLRVPDDLHLVAILNRQSRVRSPWPLIELVADGQALGRTMAELMHEQIVNPTLSPRKVVQSCQLRTYA